MNANEFSQYMKKITGPDRQRELLTSTDPVTGKSITGLKGRPAAPLSAGPGFKDGLQITEGPDGSKRMIRQNPDGTFTVGQYALRGTGDTDPMYSTGVQSADLSYIRALQGLKDPEIGFREQPVGAAEVTSALAGEPWGSKSALPGGGYPVDPSGGSIPWHLFPKEGEPRGIPELGGLDTEQKFFDYLSKYFSGLGGNGISTMPGASGIPEPGGLGIEQAFEQMFGIFKNPQALKQELLDGFTPQSLTPAVRFA